MQSKMLQLCLVTNIRSTPLPYYKNFLKNAIDGGITCVQLREKITDEEKLYLIAKDLQNFLRPQKIPLIINDHVVIAKKIDAAGVHLGQNDLAPELARKILGPHKIIGLSVESLADVIHANTLTCIDYIGASAVFPSKTKPDCKMIWGLDGLSKITTISHHPIIAIGGINKKNIRDVIKQGASGAAVIGAIHDSANTLEAAEELHLAINYALEEEQYERQNKIGF